MASSQVWERHILITPKRAETGPGYISVRLRSDTHAIAMTFQDQPFSCSV